MPKRTLLCACLAVVALTAASCRMGVGLFGVGVGVGIGSSHGAEDLGLRSEALRVDRHAVTIDLADDLTYTATIETTRTPLTEAGVQAGQNTSMTFDPRTERVSLEEASVTLADGTRVAVGADHVFTRPSVPAQRAPGFVGTSTTTVLFPQLDVGASTYVRWRREVRATPLLGFNFLYEPELATPVTDVDIRITCPASVTLRHGVRGAVVESESVQDGRRTVVARLTKYEGARHEPDMVAAKDVVPAFVATTLPSWEKIGALFHASVAPSVRVTPAIQETADRVAGKLTGIDAARALHRYVASNVRYVVAWMDGDATWTPNAADEVLRRGYGDCKDQYALLASLLEARGMRAEPVLVSWDRSWRELPVPSPLQFDHCMAYLPDFDVYSNPVNPFADLGVLGQELSGKFVVIGSAQGRVARTPAGDPSANSYRIDQDVVLRPDGSFAGTTTVRVDGRPAMKLRRVLAGDVDASDLADDVLADTPEGGVGDIRSSNPSDLSTPLSFSAEWTTLRVVEPGPTCSFSSPVGVDFVNPAKSRKLVSESGRRFPIVAAAVGVSWNTNLRLPAGTKATSMPRPRSVKNAVGSYTGAYSASADGTLHVARALRIEKDVVSPEESAQLREILDAALADARSVFVATTATP
jgi:transglutaminase-like putative cysteine protease